MYERESLWRGKYATLEDYYKGEYLSKISPEGTPYYKFTPYELEIDPDETVEDYNRYSPEQQQLEEVKCALDFFYFANKYVKILHPKRGLVRFVCYAYQHDVLDQYNKYRFNLISKFRQGGLTTLTELWGLWRCRFMVDQQIVLLSKTDAEAITAGEIINTAVKNLPTWLQPPPNEGKWNDHQKHFSNTGGKMTFGTPERARGLAITYLIIDEAAFIPDMDKYWKAIFPTISTGGNCIVVSTVNGLGNWYQKMYHKSKRTGKPFNIIDLDYIRHPDYNDPTWIAEQKSHLGDKGWRQEVLRSFLGSGETYIPSNIVANLIEKTLNNPPKRKLFKKWVNKKVAEEDDGGEEVKIDFSWEKEGAMWIWKPPQEGHEYTFGIDVADGIGDEGDNSAIQIIDNMSLEQVGEFYSNSIPPYQFAQVINELAIYYNHALVVVENMGSGGAVLSTLVHQLFYDNVYYQQGTVKNPKPGLKVTVGNRMMILETLQQHCINDTVKINSKRLAHEISTLVYNVQTGKVAAIKGEHDDAVMAMCIAIFVRNSLYRELPLGAAIPKELTNHTKTASYEEIKNEILQGTNKDLFNEIEKRKKALLTADEESSLGVAFNFRRKLNALLEEFGWIFFWLIWLVTNYNMV